MKKFLSTTLHTLLIVALVAVAGLSVATLVPIPGKVEIKIVQSGSMEPVIHTGGIVVIQPQARYDVGDVVTFGEDTKTHVPTTHRIVSERLDGSVRYFTTKGDANEEADTVEVVSSGVIGKVLFSMPYVGYLIDFAKKPVGFALLIVIPAVLIVLYEVIGIYEEVRRLHKKKKPDTDEDDPHGTQPYDTASPVIDARLVRAKNVLDLRPKHQPEVESRIVFARLSPLDDMYVPMSLHMRVERTPVSFGRYALAALMILALPTTAVLANTGSTTLYFSDSEHSNNNRFSAGLLDITLSTQSEVNASIGLGEGNGHSIVAELDAPTDILPFSYKVSAVRGGNAAFCSVLGVNAPPGPLSYSGLVVGLNSATTTDTSSWELTFFVPEDAIIPLNAQCVVTLTYDAIQDGGLFGIEYHDTEELILMFTFDDSITQQQELFELFSAFEPPAEEMSPPQEETSSQEEVPGEVVEEIQPPQTEETVVEPPPEEIPPVETVGEESVPPELPQEEEVP